jgi:RHS repeat-associated protein
VAKTPVQATVTLWTPTLLFLTVPAGAQSGLVKVFTEGKTSNGMPFMVTPGSYAGSCPAFPPNNQLQIVTSSLENGTAGQSYSVTLSATGGAASYAWAITSGSLPSGLSLTPSTGVIAGTPTGTAGPVDLTVQVTDHSSPPQTTSAVLSLTVESQTLTAGTVYSYSANYDGVGNVTSYNDSVMGAWTNIAYDSLNRLVSDTATSGAYNTQYGCWTYDSFGNRTSEAMSTTPCGNNPPLMSWATYNVSNTNRMDTDSTSTLYGATPGYDPTGNLKSDGGNTYLYDAEDRICAVQSTPVAGFTLMTGYLYDADGNRVAKGTLTNWSCDPGTSGFQLTESYVLGQAGEQLTTLDGNNNWQRTNVYGGGKLLATYDRNGLHFHLADPLGSRRLQTSAAGQPELDCQSLPFGDQQYCFPDPNSPATADDATPLHFTGKERDTESGNDYFGARYYASSMGRFMSPDWSAKMEPVPYAKLDNPQTLNLYAYVGNNPLRFVDADGHEVDLNGTDKQKAEEQRRLAANATRTDKNGMKESSLFKNVTDKNGKTTMILNKDATANWSGGHSQGFKDIVQTINNKDVVSVNLVGSDDNQTINNGNGNFTVNLATNRTAYDRVVPMKNGNSLEIIAGHEILGHARMGMLGIPDAWRDGSGSPVFQYENNVLRPEYQQAHPDGPITGPRLPMEP